MAGIRKNLQEDCLSLPARRRKQEPLNMLFFFSVTREGTRTAIVRKRRYSFSHRWYLGRTWNVTPDFYNVYFLNSYETFTKRFFRKKLTKF